MQDETRAELLSRIEAGEVPLRDLAGLSPDDVKALEHVGRVAFESGRHEKAARIFAGLEALEPDRPEHTLRRAHALSAAGSRGMAFEVVTRYLESEAHAPHQEPVDALLLRAELARERDAVLAERDLVLARIIAAEVVR
jgi:predicted Zn-dependent protease